MSTNSFSPALPSLPAYPPTRDPNPSTAHFPPTRRYAQPRNSGSSTFNTSASSAPTRQSFSHLAPSYPESAASSAPLAVRRKRGLSSCSGSGNVDAFGYPVSDRQSSSIPSRQNVNLTITNDASATEYRTAKRRIIDVVGSTVGTVVGGVIRGAWNMLPRFPFAGGGGGGTNPIPATNSTAHRPIPPTISNLKPPAQALDPVLTPSDYHRDASPMPGAFSPPSDPDLSAFHWVPVEPVVIPPRPPSPPSTGLFTSRFSHQHHPRPSTADSTSSHTSHTSFASTNTATRRPAQRRPRKASRASKRNVKSPALALAMRGGGGGGPGMDDDDDEMDEDMKRFNEKLKAMIREGKEALGARVEVVYGGVGDDEGFR
ncbi:hypothetical protein EX30DRAFT_373139 [Ascodesmis nigricans]|uniref:Uncharacterized protein n=1 Tax=Ascodesmis nigricans TaxID=341454 RepID=A0A4V3SIA4_9PEZI|nr:hypothetical protein EX30DRAFT_373139 [Ascodesmis nigricans]